MDQNSRHRGYVSVSRDFGSREETAPPASYANHHQAIPNFRNPQPYWQQGEEYNLPSPHSRGLEIRAAPHASGSTNSRNPLGPGGRVSGTPSWNQVPPPLQGSLSTQELQSTAFDQRNRDQRVVANVDSLAPGGAEALGENAYARDYTHLASTPQHQSERMMALNSPAQAPWTPITHQGYGQQTLLRSRSDNLATADNQQRRRRALDVPGQNRSNVPADLAYTTPAPLPLQQMIPRRSTADAYPLDLNSATGHGVFPENWQAGFLGPSGVPSLSDAHAGGEPFGLGPAPHSGLEPDLSNIDLVERSSVAKADESQLIPPFQGPQSPEESSLSPSPEAQSAPTVLRCPKEGCDSIFKGDYRRGNLARHIRVQHGGRQGTPKSFPCEEAGCSSTFRRKDARLKHYRKTHPERLEAPPQRRR